MNNKVFVKGALILIIFNLICKAIGALYRIPLAGILGGEGMGQYQLVFPLYSLILTVSTSGIPVAISKMVAEFNAKKEYKNSRNLLYVSLLILTAISIIGFLFVVAFAKIIAKMQGNFEAYICYYALSPAILFVGVISAFRGYFQGNLNMIPTALSNLIEQVFKLFFGLFFAKLFINNGTIYAVMGALIGITISEFFSFIYLVIYYFCHFKNVEFNDINFQIIPYKRLCNNLVKISVPVTLSGLITPITSIFDSFLVVNLLIVSGLSSTFATSLLGIQAGVVEPLIHLPVVIAISISTVLLPNISSLSANGSNDKIIELIKKSIQISLCISIAFVIGYVMFGGQILKFLYSKSFSNQEIFLSTELLFLSSLNIIFLSLVQITSGILQGLGRVKYSVKTLLIGCVFKIIFELILVPLSKINIFGVVFSGLICYLVIFTLNFIRIKKIINIKFIEVYNDVAIQETIVCVSALLFSITFKPLFSEFISMLIAGILTVLVFFASFYFIIIKRDKHNFKINFSSK